MVGLWMADSSIPLNAILTLNNAHLIKDHLALDFLIDVFKYWRQDKGEYSLLSAIKKSNIDLMSFIPDTKQSQVYFRNAFKENGLDEIMKLYNDQHQQEAKKQFQVLLADALQENKPQRDIINEIKEIATKENIKDYEIISIIWVTVMDIPEWSKKEVCDIFMFFFYFPTSFLFADKLCIFNDLLLEKLVKLNYTNTGIQRLNYAECYRVLLQKKHIQSAFAVQIVDMNN